MISLIRGLIILSISTYLFALVPILIYVFNQKTKDSKKLVIVGRFFIVLGWSFGVAVFILNWIQAQAPPFGNMYHVFIVSSIALVPAWILLRYYYRVKGGDLFFIIIAILPLIPALIKLDGAMGWRPPPALQSAYFIPHVFVYMVSYLLLGVAAVNGLFTIIDSGVVQMKYKGTLGTYLLSQNAIYQIVKMGFFFMSVGLVLGAFWAETAWGRYWGWDIKETWALINWLVYLVYFHLRYIKVSNNWKNLFLIIAFITVLITLVGVNYMDDQMSSSLHTYSKG